LAQGDCAHAHSLTPALMVVGGKRGNAKKGGDKRVAGFDEVKARNADFDRDAEKEKQEAQRIERIRKREEQEEAKAAGKGAGKAPPKVAGAYPAPADNDVDDAAADLEDMDLAPIGMEGGAPSLSRKQREELAKDAAKRRYEELHKAGKTDEYRNDMARLEKIRVERAAAAEAKAKEKKDAEAAHLASRQGMSAEIKSALGGEVRKAGSRTAKKNAEKAEKEKDEEKPTPAPTQTLAQKFSDGTMEACRDMEDDFM